MMECRLASQSNKSSMDKVWNYTALDTNTSMLRFQAPTNSPQQQLYIDIENLLYTKIILVVCIFGIVGNVLNLVVLTRKSLSTHMDRMEKAAHIGLIALAISDLLFCVAAFPQSLQDHTKFDHDHIGFWLLYKLYGTAVINIFIMSSTWLTVAMAVSRYLAICYPIKGRQLLGATFSEIVMSVVFLFCVLFNLPRFWMMKLDYVECEGGWFLYYAKQGPLKDKAEKSYMWLYFIICILVPLVVLAYCNLYLIRALRHSANMRREHARGGRDSGATSSVGDSKNIVTLTLFVIVVLYMMLVTPAEMLNFTKDYVTSSSQWAASDQYNLAVAICNTLQTVNFACNFVLYCIINVHFRKVVKQLLGCRTSQRNLSSWMLKYESMTGTTRDHDTSFPITSSRL